MKQIEENKHNPGNFFEDILLKGLKEGLKVSYSIAKIMLIASFIITMLKYSGFIEIFSNTIAPFCRFLGLQGDAVLALMSGYLINCYSAIAIITTLALTIKEVTIISIMLLLCHTLPIELAVQKRAGGPLFLIFLVRLSSSILVGALLNIIIPNNANFMGIRIDMETAAKFASFSEMMIAWLWGNVVILKIIIINIVIIIFYKLLNRIGILEKISNLFKGFMFIFGLPKETAVLWVVANVIGLIYGSSMLIEAKNNKRLNDHDLKKLNLSVSTCHSLIQETANFWAIGASVSYLIIPRVIISIITVWVYNLLFPMIRNINTFRNE